MSEHVMFGFRVNESGDWVVAEPVPATIDCDDQCVTVTTETFIIIDTFVGEHTWVRTLLTDEGITTFPPHITTDDCYVEISETAVTSHMGLL